jgi:pSer/pThr/pTyr-binding forkhead associated (FHA) protein
VPWDGPLCIGRETSTGDLAAQIARFPNVSRRHAELGWHEGRLVVTDLSSTNGTFLNGQRLPAELPQPVADGDTVRFAASLSARVRIAGPA